MKNTKLKIAYGVVLGLLLLPMASFAEESTSATTNTNVSAELKLKAEMKEKEEAKRKAALEVRADAKAEVKSNFELKKEEIRTKMEEKKEEIKNKIEERKQLVTDKIKERLSDFVGKLEKRFTSAIERLEILTTRIESRIEKMDAENINTTKSKELLVDAKAKIEIAKVSAADISVKADAVIAGDTKALYPELKATVEKAKADVKSAHAALVLVVKELKPGFNKSKDRLATTTATTTSN